MKIVKPSVEVVFHYPVDNLGYQMFQERFLERAGRTLRIWEKFSEK